MNKMEQILKELQEILDNDNDTLSAETFYRNVKNSHGYNNEKLAEIFGIDEKLVKAIREYNE